MIRYTSEEALYIGSRIKSVFDHQMYPEMVPREMLLCTAFSHSKSLIRSALITSKQTYWLLPPFKKNRFLFQFSCVSERNVYGNKGRTNCPDLFGASHLDDLCYLFDPKRFNLQVDMDTKSYKMIKQTGALFANFAKESNASWLEVGCDLVTIRPKQQKLFGHRRNSDSGKRPWRENVSVLAERSR
ncbi:hypothetical protein EVAR_57279_1 [Eumeta japonica]|uniref:Uncharacterized protein n=1 Tax=Eumeta variegata TaxID=151549 RepID=A0A4C2A152_EUMVA|nr:hypothetical protein EVAR_57279_1 [Eumeta japonica]